MDSCTDSNTKLMRTQDMQYTNTKNSEASPAYYPRHVTRLLKEITSATKWINKTNLTTTKRKKGFNIHPALLVTVSFIFTIIKYASPDHNIMDKLLYMTNI